jgi:hypothetical protein
LKRMEQQSEDVTAGRDWNSRQWMELQAENETAGSGQNIRQDTE